MKTFDLKTLGCKVNQYESQALRERLLGLGLKEADGQAADICIVNTCSVTQRAEADSLEAVRAFNRNNPQAKIFVTGCSAQNSPGLIKNLNGVNAVLGNNEKDSLPEIISENQDDHRDTACPAPTSSERPILNSFHRHTRAFLKVQDGCDYGCSYCIIPKLRGASRSRGLTRIIEEARQLTDNGYKEIVLCGICLGAYGRDLGYQEGLVRLIGELEKIPGLTRLRLSSIEASDVSQELIRKITASAKLCRHLHIPFQNGDDQILKLMRRRVLSKGYLKLVHSLRQGSPDIGITTDIMVGFPGEKEVNFKNTLDFLKEVKPSRIHIFPFSPRKDTPAYDFKDTLKSGIIKERCQIMKSLAKELAQDFCRRNLDKELEVLVEANAGYSSNYIKVYIAGADIPANSLIKIRAQKLYKDGLYALR